MVPTWTNPIFSMVPEYEGPKYNAEQLPPSRPMNRWYNSGHGQCVELFILLLS